MAAKGSGPTMRSRISWLAVLIVVLGFGLVAARLFYMQVLRNDFYVQQATTLQTRDTLVTPNRGTIYDANMQVLAESATVSRITVNPKAIISDTKTRNGITPQQQQEGISRIMADTLGEDYNNVLSKVQKTDTMYQIIAQKVDKDTENELNAQLKASGYTTGVIPEPDTKRYYKYGAFLSTVLGYVNDDNVGVYGLESEYESELAGTAGRIVRAQNAKNQDMPYDYQQYIPATDGNSLVLTIDSDIQNILEKQLATALADNPQARDGVSGIVMDVKTGAVLAMANMPDFDPNQPRVITDERYLNELKTNVEKILKDAGVTADISDKYYSEGGLDNLPENVKTNDALIDQLTEARTQELYKMWYNPVVTDSYEPGSTFKLMNVATAYELGAVHAEDTFYCGGSMMVGDWKEPIYCANRSGHGMQTLTEALMNSCNVAMMQIVAKTGRERFYDFFKAFGMNTQTGIDLPNESPGIFFDTSNLTSWNEVSLAVASFGQRFQVTPVQMASMVSAIVDDGKLKKPYVVKEILGADGSIKSSTETEVVRQVISEETSAYMRDAMLQVVEQGTGKNAYVPGYRVGGKTATSEIRKEATDTEDRYTASFIGVAPMDDPQIVVLVAISDLPESVAHGGGAIAAPVVGRIMEDVLPYLGVTPSYSDDENDRRELTVPGVVGSTETQAAATLQQAGFDYVVYGEGDTVTDQVPASGIRIPASGRIILYMGEEKPTEPIEVPNLTGMTPDGCRETLAEYGLYLKQKGVASSQITGDTTASKQSPAAGTKVSIGSVITVEFSDTTTVNDR